MIHLAAYCLIAALAAEATPHAGQFFQITVIDEQTGRGVPLVELRTVDNVSYWTDSNGVVAYYEPGLMGQRVFFHVASDGYEFPKDGFGYRGRALDVSEGDRAELKVKRLNIAERLYRVTGAGIYRDSVLVGREVPIRQPLLNAHVFGSDSVVNAVFQGNIHWFWGDTNRPAYPLGNFHVPGATSRLPQDGGLDPAVGVELEYFLDDKGFAKETARMPGDGPTWINGLVVLRDETGRERMFASYVKVRGFLNVYQRGLAEFDAARQQFDKVCEFAMDAPIHPGGHPLQYTDSGVEYIYFANPYPLVRVRATPQHLRDLNEYEAYTCLKAGSRLEQPQVDRGDDGTLRYAWKKNTPVVGQREQETLIKQGLIQPHEALLRLQDSSGKRVMAHAGSVYWNDYRRRWIMIAEESGGTSPLGEVWFAEAETPTGPWVHAVKIVTHNKYSFYNPKQHSMFDKDGGRVIFFEGTYSDFFSGAPAKTPRYDYNQIMYKLDLSDPRLDLPPR